MVNKKQRAISFDTRAKKKSMETYQRKCNQKGIFIDMINGYQEHCHCLISLGIDQTISKIMQLLKGESSYWINKNGLCSEKFEWQDEYFASSVSESLVSRVREYIKNQEDHHQTKTFAEEYDLLIKKFEFLKNQR